MSNTFGPALKESMTPDPGLPGPAQPRGCPAPFRAAGPCCIPHSTLSVGLEGGFTQIEKIQHLTSQRSLSCP